MAKLKASDADLGDVFGSSVSISGERLVVGAPAEPDGAQRPGAAYVFERDESGRWVEVRKLQASDGRAFEQFGDSVSISGGKLVVGAGDSSNDFFRSVGSAYLFERDESDGWVEVAEILASDGALGDQFGRSVALSGERAVVGALNDDDLGFNSGSAYTYFFEPCLLELRVSPDAVRVGGEVTVAIHLEHNRFATVTVPLVLWIEAADGAVVARREAGPRTFRHGDVVDIEVVVVLPRDLPVGRYRVIVGVEEMQQDVAWAAERFRVRR